MRFWKKLIFALVFIVLGAGLAVGGYFIYESNHPAAPPVEQAVIVELNNRIDELELKLGQSEEESELKSTKITELEQNVEKIESQKQELENKNSINLAEIQKLTEEKTALMAERDSLSADNEEAQETITTINARLAEIEEEVQGLETSNAEFSQQISQLEADKENLIEQLSVAQTSLAASQAEVAELTSQITELRSSLVYYIENGVTLDSEKYAVARFMVKDELHTAQVVLKGTCLNVAEPSVKGYKFNGWYLNDTLIELATYPININATFVADMPEFNLEIATWEEISEISESGKVDHYFSVGELKKVKYYSEELTFAIMGFNHDDLADGTGKAGITFGMVECDKSNMSLGGSDWGSSIIRTESLESWYYKNLPEDLQGFIKNVRKCYVSNNGELLFSEDKLWLFSEVEITGIEDSLYCQEGSQYEYWKTVKDGSKAFDRRIVSIEKKSVSWYLRTSLVDSSNFKYITTQGNISTSSSLNTYATVFGFCI